MRTKPLQSLLALLLTLVMLLGSTPALAAVTAGQTVSKDSKWINSDIIGAVDENTQVSLKDDFHTAVNLEWMLSTEDGDGLFQSAQYLLYDRKLSIVLGETDIDPANADAIGLSSEWLAHDLKLVQTFSSLAGEWKYRNANGIEPARPFLEAIASIQTMDELSAFMFNASNMNISGLTLAGIDCVADPETKATYVATIQPNHQFSLIDQDEYSYLSSSGHIRRFGIDAAVQYLLQKLGYTQSEISTLLRKCYRFEGRLAENMKQTTAAQTIDYKNSGEKYTLAELSALAGNYPIAQQLELSGIQPQDTYLVFEPNYLRNLGKLYQPSYLEEIKAMLMVHTVCELLPLLDEAAYDKAAEIFGSITALDEHEDGDTVEHGDKELADKRQDAAEFVFDNYLAYYLPGPMDQIYVAAYCTPQLKNDIRTLIDDVIGYYREMILTVDWLSENARNATVEKLDNMLIRCVYPDSFVDYTGLTFKGCRNNEGGTLPEAVVAIKNFHRQRNLAKVGQTVDRYEWDMSNPDLSTTVCNAYYMPTENSMNILAGFVTEVMYTPDMPYEKLLAIVGTTIGHEITHAFDTQGYRFDKEGNLNPWWSLADVEAFDLRANKLIKYYDRLTAYPNAFMFYSGSKVSGEVIADMGGVKCMLNIAKAQPDFDYELFFKSYAELWAVVRSLEEEKMLVDSDPHPLAYLRTNVTLMQFDEFCQTFDIQPGDGMYMEPAKRINVW